MTKDLEILQSAATLLASAGVASGRIWKARGDRIAEGQLPAVDLWLDDGRHEDIGRPTIVHETLLQVEIVAQEDGTKSCLEVAEPVRALAHSALMADRTLGGKVANIRPDRTNRIYDAANGSLVRVQCFYAVKFHTRAGSLAS